MNKAKLPRALLWVAYPLLVFGGLQFLQPRYVALLLIVALLIRRRAGAAHLFGGLGVPERMILVALLSLSATAAWMNSETLLRLYPAAINLGMLLLFGLSLKRAPSMIERFARMEDPNLPPAGVRYTRDLTVVWCGFLALNGVIAAYTAFWTSREIWALYNALIAYALMGLLFGGERLLRHRLIARYA
jgi:uncharacterized membrane protein